MKFSSLSKNYSKFNHRYDWSRRPCIFTTNFAKGRVVYVKFHLSFIDIIRTVLFRYFLTLTVNWTDYTRAPIVNLQFWNWSEWRLNLEFKWALVFFLTPRYDRGPVTTNRAGFIRYDNKNVNVDRVQCHCIWSRIPNLEKKPNTILKWPSNELSIRSFHHFFLGCLRLMRTISLNHWIRPCPTYHQKSSADLFSFLWLVNLANVMSNTTEEDRERRPV